MKIATFCLFNGEQRVFAQRKLFLMNFKYSGIKIGRIEKFKGIFNGIS